MLEPEAGGWKLDAGGWKLEAGGWKLKTIGFVSFLVVPGVEILKNHWFCNVFGARGARIVEKTLVFKGFWGSRRRGLRVVPFETFWDLWEIQPSSSPVEPFRAHGSSTVNG